MADRDLTAVVGLVQQIQPALEQADRPKLRNLIEALVQARAPMGGQWHSLAGIAAGIGELGLSRQAIDLFLEDAGGTPAARYQKAVFLAEWGAPREAEAMLQALPEEQPNPAANAYSRAMVALNLGKADEARELLERVTRLAPKAGSAWLMLVASANLADDQELAERLFAAESGMGDAEPGQRGAYFYALGKAHADRGEHSLALAAFIRGAEQMKALAIYDRAKDHAQAEDAVSGYDAQRIAALAARQREPTGQTIFVTGLPRSGTTLIQHILSGHPDVCGGAETSWLALLAMEVGGRSHSALVRHVAAEGSGAAAKLWHHLVKERFPAPGRVVDKSVDTSRFLGLAAALLPDAPLIWTTRDPLDRAWSCFRTNFAGGAIPWSYDLSDIAAHFRLEDRLLAKWQEILGDRLMVVPYEELASNPRDWTRRLLAHCGLSDDAGLRASHEVDRPVTTASLIQVRQPIHRESIGTAEPYREFLETFVRAYRG